MRSGFHFRSCLFTANLREHIFLASTAADATNGICRDDHLLQLKCLASYILQLSLLDYVVLQYAPQLVAASAGFLARFILSPSDKPWDAKLREYTLYQPSDLEECIKLEECVKALHRLYRNEGGASLSAIAAKYSQSKYCSVSKRECKATIPEQLFWAV
ncbi:cyclin-A1-4-like [Hibiscus syriacus]|uniref:cyclin-A1-4-like n=1 Tax=Hibiscus syriacus TaxID=106335 RepID=UPI001923524C|nr:cyclin-A1-4-like [Hibiscus syriacus]